jgi:hypothetical protein
MSMIFDFSPQEEATLATVAQQAGIAPAEYVRKVVKEHLPASTVDSETDPFLARLEARLAQAPTDPEKIREAEEDLAEFMRNMNQTRRDAGERLLYPEVE